MAGIRQIINAAVYWTLPKGVHDLLSKFASKPPALSRKIIEVIGKNTKFENIHSGKRCFILCNGESVATQDLTPLKDEIVFSVSQGYFLEQYKIIKPKYHCSPQFTYSSIFTEQVATDYLKEMDSLTGNAEIFLSANEKYIVDKSSIFSGRNISYLHFCHGLQAYAQDALIDIAKPVPTAQSAPVMCLMIAMYMGLKEIYLIGVDHDSFQKGYYRYPFSSRVLAQKAAGITTDGKVTSLYDELQATITLWQQYRFIKNIAQINGCKIYNATNGGALDVFERVALDDLFKD